MIGFDRTPTPEEARRWGLSMLRATKEYQTLAKELAPSDDEYDTSRYLTVDLAAKLANGISPEQRQREYRARQRRDIAKAWRSLRVALKDWLLHRTYHPLNGR